MTFGPDFNLYLASANNNSIPRYGIKPLVIVSPNGSWQLLIAVPNSASGPHLVDAFGTTTLAADVPDQTFTVTPSIAISPGIGPVSTTVAVSGSGFAANETDITVTYDGATVAGPVTSSASGNWNATFDVPPSAAGPHTVDAFGTTTPAIEVPDLTYAVNAAIEIGPIIGPVGSIVHVTGTKFALAETGIQVTFGGVPVSTTPASIVATTSTGAWSATFPVPNTVGGAHVVGAAGPQTLGVAGQVFTVTGSIAIAPNVGPVGTTVTTTGTNFAPNETGIQVTFDGAPVGTTTANVNSDWSATFTVPEAPGGSRSVGASGSQTQSVAPQTFTVTPSIALDPSRGAIGDLVNVSGFGFGPTRRESSWPSMGWRSSASRPPLRLPQPVAGRPLSRCR